MGGGKHGRAHIGEAAVGAAQGFGHGGERCDLNAPAQLVVATHGTLVAAVAVELLLLLAAADGAGEPVVVIAHVIDGGELMAQGGGKLHPLTAAAGGADAGFEGGLGAGGRRLGPIAEGMGAVGAVADHIAHVIQGGLAVFQALVGHHSVDRLLGGHAIHAGRLAEFILHHMVEAVGVGVIKREQGVHGGGAALDEAAVRVGIDTQGCAGHDDLGRTLGVHRLIGGVRAVLILEVRQALDAPGDGDADIFTVPIPGQGLEGHGRHIGVAFFGVLGIGPAAVGKLAVEQIGETALARVAGLGLILRRVQGDERKHDTVEALAGDPVEVLIGRGQAPVAHLCHIPAQSGEGEDEAGVLCAFHGVEGAVLVDLGSLLVHIGHHIVIIIVQQLIALGQAAAAGQAQNDPFIAEFRVGEGRELLGESLRKRLVHRGGGGGGRHRPQAQQQEQGQQQGRKALADGMFYGLHFSLLRQFLMMYQSPVSGSS